MLCADQTSPSPAEALRPSGAAPRIIVGECSTVARAGEPHTLIEDEIHVWHASPFGASVDESSFRKLLSKDELTRMERFRFDDDQRNFLFCRSMLRILLASYVGTSPAELLFAYSAHGKPSLATSTGSVEFNLSHSNGNVLIAITRDRKIGVDIECLSRDVDVLDISQRFFSPAEHFSLQALPPIERQRAFFSCWTRKEAFVKALGEGLSCPLDSFDVSITPDEESVEFVTRSRDIGYWGLRSLNYWPDFAAAIAVESTNKGLDHPEQRQ